jgi:hypothetical protein
MKAFDTIDWSFLLEVLRKMGFGDRILACIAHCSQWLLPVFS